MFSNVGTETKKKWWSKKDNFTRLRNAKTKPGQATDTKLNSWKWYKYLDFLVPFIHEARCLFNRVQLVYIMVSYKIILISLVTSIHEKPKQKLQQSRREEKGYIIHYISVNFETST